MVRLDPLYASLQALFHKHNIHITTKSAQKLTLEYQALKNKSRGQTLSESESWTYAAYRMPGTVAANIRVFQEIYSSQGKTLLDLGAGTGSATWAALDSFPLLEKATLVERSQTSLRMAEALLLAQYPLKSIFFKKNNLEDYKFESTYDFVVLSYVLNELSARQKTELIQKAWTHTQQHLIIIEPGHKEAFQDLLKIRTWALENHISIQAPCSHNGTCPLQESDWCHFTARFERSTLLRQLKKGSLSYEDEPFCYLILTKNLSHYQGSRIIRPPQIMNKGVQITLCHPEKALISTTHKKDSIYKAARKVKWGDIWPLPNLD